MRDDRPEITPALVRGLWAHLERAFGSRTLPRAESPLMRAAGVGLAAAGILDRETFLGRFTTVVGRRIYVPFTPGRPGGIGLRQQLHTCVHEHQHIVQLDREGRARFWASYLGSSRARALYEAEAYTCGLELSWWFEGRLPDPAQTAQVLGQYGCSEADIQAAAERLADHATRIRRGEWITRATRVALPWLRSATPARAGDRA